MLEDRYFGPTSRLDYRAQAVMSSHAEFRRFAAPLVWAVFPDARLRDACMGADGPAHAPGTTSEAVRHLLVGLFSADLRRHRDGAARHARHPQTRPAGAREPDSAHARGDRAR